MRTLFTGLLIGAVLSGAAFYAFQDRAPKVELDKDYDNPFYFLRELLECKRFDLPVYELAPALDEMGAVKLAHDSDEFGDQSWTYEIKPALAVYGYPVTKIGLYQLSGDGGNLSYGMSAYFDVSVEALARAADVTPDPEVDGFSQQVNENATRVISVRDGLTRSFCDVSVEEDFESYESN